MDEGQNDEISFIIAQNYPAVRKFVVQKPMKKSIMDSFKELLVGRG
ncbi:MAG: hypothetical protein ABII71_02865 [Candidatus Micrarchaeota archaeon]